MSLPGDFDESGALDAADIDILTRAVRTGALTRELDLNQDEQLDQTDRRMWVEQLFGTFFGDANLDYEFNSSDFVVVLQAGQYEDTTPLNSTWSTGDWDGDGDFSTADLVFAFGSHGYEQGPRSARSPVPEPVGLGWLAIAALVWRARHRPQPSCTGGAAETRAATRSPL